MNNTRIHFIGTLHTDPLGSERLWKALKYEQPDAVAVECSPELWKYIDSGEWLEKGKKVLEEVRRRGLSDSAYKFILEEMESQNFEIRVPLGYGRISTIPVHLVDSRKTLDEILCDENIRINIEQLNRVTKKVRMQEAERLYANLDEIFRRSDVGTLACEYLLTARTEKDYTGRDDYAEQKIREIINDGMKLMVVYGLAHCLKDQFKRSLFSRLDDFNPTRATLKSYEEE